MDLLKKVAIVVDTRHRYHFLVCTNVITFFIILIDTFKISEIIISNRLLRIVWFKEIVVSLTSRIASSAVEILGLL